MMISSWLHFQPLFPKYHPFSVSFSFVMMITKHYIFHFLDKQLHPLLNQVVPRQPYVGQRQQLPEGTEGVAAHFHYKVIFLKMMRMATIITIITIVILNKSLSGKWRGRILGNTLAGASKLFPHCMIHFVSTSWIYSNLESILISQFDHLLWSEFFSPSICTLAISGRRIPLENSPRKYFSQVQSFLFLRTTESSIKSVVFFPHHHCHVWCSVWP